MKEIPIKITYHCSHVELIMIHVHKAHHLMDESKYKVIGQFTR